MKHDRRRSHEPKLCDRIHADDGVEAEELFFSRRKFDRSGDRKTRQLCKVVQRALGAALAGDCRDDLLRELVIQSVDTPELLGQIVRQLLGGEALDYGINVQDCFERHGGNVRSALRELYDRYCGGQGAASLIDRPDQASPARTR